MDLSCPSAHCMREIPNALGVCKAIGETFLLQSVISAAFPKLFPLLTVSRWNISEPKPLRSSLKRGDLHACADAGTQTVFSVRCGLMQQFSLAQLLF